jgi:hypothetical protein
MESPGRVEASTSRCLWSTIVLGVCRYHPSLGVRLLDALLEDIRSGLETPQGGANHSRCKLCCSLSCLLQEPLQ